MSVMLILVTVIQEVFQGELVQEGHVADDTVEELVSPQSVMLSLSQEGLQYLEVSLHGPDPYLSQERLAWCHLNLDRMPRRVAGPNVTREEGNRALARSTNEL